MQRLLQRIESDAGSQRCRRSPTDDESSEDVDDEGDIHEAAPRGNVGQVRDPELVRACGVEVALHEVHRASAARIRLRRLESASTDRVLEAHFTHQTGHRASSHVAALTAKLTPDLAHAIHVKVLLPYTTNLAAELDVALRSRWLAAWVLVPSIYSSARPEPDRSPICRDYACMISSFVRARPWARPQTQTLSC